MPTIRDGVTQWDVERISLSVPQGIGDICWIYQKISPYVQRIDWRIMVTDPGNHLQARAVPWLLLLPKTGHVQLHAVEQAEYDRVCQRCPPLAEVLARPHSFYGCNSPLEKGTKLWDIDPDFPIQDKVPLIINDKCPPPYKRYLCVYVSGDTKHQRGTTQCVWTVEQWADLIGRVRYGVTPALPLVLLGAIYDAPVLDELARRCGEAKVLLDQPPPDVLALLKNATYFVGYQSGLSVLAAQLGTPQLMLYYPSLGRMLYTWTRDSGYRATTFAASPAEAAALVELPG